ncbi:MAG: lipid-A-disaccharide synthase [Victivallales bacterium]|nr:lipid-A-disaccharide synthase [Victivallales bacterium]
MNTKKNIWIFAGESSGDMYGAKLAESLKKYRGNDITISGMGASAMKKAGVNIIVDSTELGVVGLIEVFKNIFTFIKLFLSLVKRAEKERPDAVVLIDYPGFNIRFAKQMHKRGIPVVWYISPHVWVWGKRRIPKLAKYCNKMLVIFPFEIDVYAGTNLDVEFVGHPLVDIINSLEDPGIKKDDNTFLLLPGSRSHEIERLLPPMLGAAVQLQNKYPDLKFIISAERPAIENKINELFEQFNIDNNNSLNNLNIEIRRENAKKLQQEAGTALATSGTVTVECTLNRLPIVSVYKLNPLTYLIAKFIAFVFNLKLFRGFFTMPNIVANKMVFEEILQSDVSSRTLFEASERILPGKPTREIVEKDIEELIELLSAGKTNVSENVANSVLKVIE